MFDEARNLANGPADSRCLFANTPVAPGPGAIFPVQAVRNSSWHFPAVSPAVLRFLEQAIPSKRTIGVCLAVVFVSSVFYSWISPERPVAEDYKISVAMPLVFLVGW